MVVSVRAHQDRLYILTQNSKFFIYTLDGKLIRHLDRGTTNTWGNKICIINDQIIVADPARKHLQFYSPEGNTIQTISVPSLPDNSGYFSITPLGTNSLIVASSQGTIFTINRHTGQVIWTSSHKFTDTAVVALGDDTVLLSGANYNAKSSEILIKVLNITTGNDIHYTQMIEFCLMHTNLTSARFNYYVEIPVDKEAGSNGLL